MSEKKPLEVGILCGGKSSQNTYNSLVKMYHYAKENGYSDINVNFIGPELEEYKEVIEEVREYLTSYSSIHTIQFGTEEDSPNDIELNKTLDNKTITEMTNRYLMVHDKLLQILDKVKEN